MSDSNLNWISVKMAMFYVTLDVDGKGRYYSGLRRAETWQKAVDSLRKDIGKPNAVLYDIKQARGCS